jgi:hypothetical protein
MHLTMADSGLLALDDGTNVFWPLFSFSLRAASEPAVDLDAGEARRGEARRDDYQSAGFVDTGAGTILTSLTRLHG